MMSELTQEESDLLCHALGVHSRWQTAYRNYFGATVGGHDDAVWAGMVSRGLAVVRMEPLEWLPDRVYAVTEAGKASVAGRWRHDGKEVKP